MNKTIKFIKEVEGKDTNLLYHKTEYTGSLKPIIVTCKIHGDFTTTPNRFKSSKGCKRCSYDSQKSNVNSFVKKCELKHAGKFLYNKVDYVNARTSIVVTCKKHGDFITTPNQILTGNCKECGLDKKRKTK